MLLGSNPGAGFNVDPQIIYWWKRNLKLIYSLRPFYKHRRIYMKWLQRCLQELKTKSISYSINRWVKGFLRGMRIIGLRKLHVKTIFHNLIIHPWMVFNSLILHLKLPKPLNCNRKRRIIKALSKNPCWDPLCRARQRPKQFPAEESCLSRKIRAWNHTENPSKRGKRTARNRVSSCFLILLAYLGGITQRRDAWTTRDRKPLRWSSWTPSTQIQS